MCRFDDPSERHASTRLRTHTSELDVGSWIEYNKYVLKMSFPDCNFCRILQFRLRVCLSIMSNSLNPLFCIDCKFISVYPTNQTQDSEKHSDQKNGPFSAYTLIQCAGIILVVLILFDMIKSMFFSNHLSLSKYL